MLWRHFRGLKIYSSKQFKLTCFYQWQYLKLTDKSWILKSHYEMLNSFVGWPFDWISLTSCLHVCVSRPLLRRVCILRNYILYDNIGGTFDAEFFYSRRDWTRTHSCTVPVTSNTPILAHYKVSLSLVYMWVMTWICNQWISEKVLR